ncbi:myosin-IIIb isoform X3 [Latimeria chalumnae]|uniref:myosin-IIIb isoform X3 n=1 Tax=Latimeria chalumnae TaxID=7897 RepID=UPI00313DFEC6
MAAGQRDDLAGLSELNEAGLLEDLRSRFYSQRIYTYIGDILIAINPFKSLPLYEKSVSEKYKNHEKNSLPPHIFAVADRAYQCMLGRLGTGPRNQCIVISGESGAGKTESTKLLLRQIMELCRGNSQLEQQVLQVNPLLEAFGNAQTVMNDNSSRFGKYIQLRFLNTSVKGAKINEYLLEKSRVVQQDEGEQNFHIFYYMFAGISAADKEIYGLLEPTPYRYLNHKYGTEEKIQHWGKKYHNVCNAMDMVGFHEREKVDMLTILAGILSLGNIVFQPQDSGILKVTEHSKGWLKAAAGQFGVQEEEVLKCLICTVNVTRGENIQRYHSQQQAEDARDSIAKVVYGRVFGWIVSKVNELLAPNLDSDVELREIGILDIFGFENFAVNRYEQLCINLANEQLQYFFNQHIFLMEQSEYKQEEVSWENIDFKDNKPILDLFLAKPLGIMSLLDEQSAFPQATDQAFVDKLNSSFKKNPHFLIGRSRNPVFSVVHYAGKVEYNASGFLERNRDTIPANIRGLFINSVTPLLSVLFAATISRTGTLMPQHKSKQQTSAPDNFNAKRKQSVGAQFRHSLVVLMEKMFAANPHFVRCIKPNSSKQPDLLDDNRVMDQLRYNGLLETIRIRRDGFPWRPTFEEFAQSCLAILHNTDLKDWKCGKSRLFFKYWHQESLVKYVDRLEAMAVNIQKAFRRLVCRRRYVVLLTELKKQRAMEVERERQLQLKKEAEKRRQLELEEEEEKKRKLEMEQENQRPMTAPVPFPRKQRPVSEPSPQPRPRSAMLDNLQPPVPRPRSKLFEATPFDNALDHNASPQSGKQESGEAKQRHLQRSATIRWFRETQVQKVVCNGTFPCWFHGMITRRQAENLMVDQLAGCFLIRVSQCREGYILTFRGQDRCRHYMIDMQPNRKYVILGEDRAHPSLPDLVEYHKKVGIKPFMEVLTVPCGQKCEQEPDYEELKHLMKMLPCGTGEIALEPPLVGSSQEQVHSELPKLLKLNNSDHAPDDKPSPVLHASEHGSPPRILKRVSNKKLRFALRRHSQNSAEKESAEEEPQSSTRVFPRLYPSIRLAMREIQQLHQINPWNDGRREAPGVAEGT